MCWISRPSVTSWRTTKQCRPIAQTLPPPRDKTNNIPTKG
nr:MAG TPA: hypothetical protein [Caudoviricetes sp.]